MKETKTILVVDDEEVTTELAKTFLERYGFEVECAYDGQEALDIVESVKPDLILLDVMLPKVNGFEICKRLRSKSAFDDTPILMFTAKGLSKDVEKGRQCGADEYIIKPFSGKALVTIINKHLGIEEPVS